MGVDSWPTAGGSISRATDAGAPRRSGRVDGDYYAPTPPRRSAGPGAGVERPGTRTGGSRTNGSRTNGNQPTGPARHRLTRVETARRSGGPLGDHRGLTAAGAFVLLLVFAVLGAVIDRIVGRELWVFFAVGLVAAVLLNALRIHLEDLVASIVMVPLAFAIAGGGLSLLIETFGAGSTLKQNVVSVAGTLVFAAPTLLLAVLTAVVGALVRGRAATLARRRARARTTRRYGSLPPGSRPRRTLQRGPARSR